ncbi:uncharacterized protein LOC128989415 [Macrosteles quadrilineatus]|uniref:uncharacterized protein LOC128989415 n=1 Tax=Macrosteles quadrilineatus TaxID=74068 RepID=UPI0023E21FBB|nr:uncharacterized protein LOC128989415 [Macrosteles quadrilineatus]
MSSDVKQVADDSVDSSSSASMTGNNNNNKSKNNNNNNVLKMGPLFLTQSAELYYKQLIAANVAALTKPRLAATVRTTLNRTLDQKAAFVWEGAGGQHGGGGSAGVSGAHGKCGGPAGGQGQGNLVHWMSVMAEHMNNVGTNHHDGIHYMAWNGGVEQCGPHAKDMDYSWGRQSMAKQGYEAKMSTDQQTNHGVDDGRMDPPGGLGGLYGGAARSHSSSSSSASPPHGAATLIVPHPLAAKGPDQHHVVTHNGSGRKYQCKMCPTMAGSHPHHHSAHTHNHAHSMYNHEKMQRPLLNSQGKDNVVADCLSRMFEEGPPSITSPVACPPPITSPVACSPTSDHPHQINVLFKIPDAFKDIREHQSEDTVTQQIIKSLKGKKPPPNYSMVDNRSSGANDRGEERIVPLNLLRNSLRIHAHQH